MDEFQLHTRDILQINGTIISGILILMTIGTFQDQNSEVFGVLPFRAMIALTIIPFVMSAFFGIFLVAKEKDDNKTVKQRTKFYKWSIGSMGSGFIYFLILVFFIFSESYTEWIVSSNSTLP